MKFRTPINLVLANCPVSYSKLNNTASALQLLVLATLPAAKLVTQLFTTYTTPFLQPLTRPDASGTPHHLTAHFFHVITMRIPLWTQVLRYV